MSQNSERAAPHQTGVPADADRNDANDANDAKVTALRPEVVTGSRDATRAIDPAARKSKRMYQGLSSSSVGLELGIAVILGVLFGMWLDKQLGTEPWMMLLFLVLGLIAGFRNVMRAVARAEKVEL